MPEPIRIATRQSPLALWQANWVRDQILAFNPAQPVELLPLTTRGDENQQTSLAKIGGKGLFLKELEHALIDKTADIAVHSMKDVTADIPDGLVIDTVLERHNPQDAFVCNEYASLEALPDDAVIGTCSPRRQAQLLHYKPNLKIVELRGNVGTRLKKLDAGEFDATLLACAGLERLDLDTRIAQAIDINISLPAGTQGTIGVERRADDERIKEVLAPMNHIPTRIRTSAERAFTARLNGGCSAPIAAYATLRDQSVHLKARVISLDGKQLLEAEGVVPWDDAHKLGADLAVELLERGAQEILDQAETGLQA